jgi:hypothetical protein
MLSVSAKQLASTIIMLLAWLFFFNFSLDQLHF